MTAPAHTDGEWFVDRDGDVQIRQSKEQEACVALVASKHIDYPAAKSEGEVRANAHLISAAPKLLKAIKGILADDAPDTSLKDQRARWEKRMAEAQAAVDKAEGRAP